MIPFLTHLYPPVELPTLVAFDRSGGKPAAAPPYPSLTDRPGWQALPDDVRQVLLARGEEALAKAWPQLPASLYLEYARDGNRSRFEASYFLRRDLLAYLVLAECVEGRGRFLDAVVDAAWSICEESSWCLPAHIAEQRAGPGLPDVAEPVVDLFAAETASLLAWTNFLVGPALSSRSPRAAPRIELEVRQRVLDPALQRDDFWWMGFTSRPVNNWNPWINANWLTALLLTEQDEGRFYQALVKIMRSLDRFIAPYPDDGGCDEGPSYWGRAGASLYDCLELLLWASAGRIAVYDHPKIQNIARFIYRAHIADDYYVNFADAPAVLTPDASLAAGFGRRIQDNQMTAYAAWLANRRLQAAPFSRRDPVRDLGRALASLFRPASPLGQPASPETGAPLLGDVWLPDIQVMAARDRPGSAAGLYLAAKGGHNAESHNHNDVGSFIVYYDGSPLIIDVGVETYTRKTFSPQRYEIWTMQSAYHALPTVNGVMQSPGMEYAARSVVYSVSEHLAQLSLDLAGAYPPEAGLRAWVRRIGLERGRRVVLEERFAFDQFPRSLALNLITPCDVVEISPSQVSLAARRLPQGRASAAGVIVFAPGMFTVVSQLIPITDDRLAPIWGDHVARLVFELNQPFLPGASQAVDGWTIQFLGAGK